MTKTESKGLSRPLLLAIVGLVVIGIGVAAFLLLSPASLEGEIIFLRGGFNERDIIHVNLADSEETTLTNEPADINWLNWKPDGTSLIFNMEVEYKLGIYSMDADGSNLVELTADDPNDFNYPVWMPDGENILVQVNTELHLFNPDDGLSDAITDTDVVREQAISPDGETIIFETGLGGQERLFTTTINGDEPVQYSERRMFDLAWSPDGTQVVFASDYSNQNLELFVMTVGETNTWTPLTDNDADERHPAWSPDGSQIVFTSNRDGNWEVYVMNADGSGQTRITDTEADEQQPKWRPVLQSE